MGDRFTEPGAGLKLLAKSGSRIIVTWSLTLSVLISSPNLGLYAALQDLALPDLLFNRVIQYSEKARGLTFAVRVVPRASRTEIAGEYNGALRIRIAAPPVEGAANQELIRLLARVFKLPQNAVEIISGAASKNKIVNIVGADAARLENLILLK
jgi:uncharacterized protein (TIGR00251 family)